jgi:hypothetical protein
MLCWQHYENHSREKQAETHTSTGVSTFSGPVLKEGEIIQCDRSSGKHQSTTKKKSARGGSHVVEEATTTSIGKFEQEQAEVSSSPAAGTTKEAAATRQRCDRDDG